MMPGQRQARDQPHVCQLLMFATLHTGGAGFADQMPSVNVDIVRWSPSKPNDKMVQCLPTHCCESCLQHGDRLKAEKSPPLQVARLARGTNIRETLFITILLCNHQCQCQLCVPLNFLALIKCETLILSIFMVYDFCFKQKNNYSFCILLF